MDSTRVYSLLLMGLLPLFALLIYFDGRSYDPALIDFQQQAAPVTALQSFLPTEIAGFRMAGRARHYTRDNLYEYVNGHAEYFISAGFGGMVVGEYSSGTSPGGGPDVVVDIYDMTQSIQAFGVLSDESGGNTRTLPGGAAGFSTDRGLAFSKGRYYVKISAFREGAPLEAFAGSIDRLMGEGADPFPEFSRFPRIGDVVQTRFIREAYRGLDFMNNVIEREFVVDGSPVQISLVTGDEETIKRLVRSFTDFFRHSGVTYEETGGAGQTRYYVNDPYEGDWVLIPRSDALFGVYGSFNEGVLNAISGTSDNLQG